MPKQIVKIIEALLFQETCLPGRGKCIKLAARSLPSPNVVFALPGLKKFVPWLPSRHDVDKISQQTVRGSGRAWICLYDRKVSQYIGIEFDQ